MQQKEFCELCKQSLPIKVESSEYGDITITFDNGIIVEIGTCTGYEDSSYFTFETNKEKEANRIVIDMENRHREEKRNALLEKRALVRAKFTDTEWAEIEQAFIDAPNITEEQWQARINGERRWILDIHQKYNSETYSYMLQLLSPEAKEGLPIHE